MLRKQRLGEKFSGAVEVRILQTGISSPAGFSSGAASGLGVAGFFAAFFAGFFALILAFFAGIPSVMLKIASILIHDVVEAI
jgi:hypothetical protein